MGEKDLATQIVEKLLSMVKGDDEVLGIYEHYKGGLYVVLCLGIDSGTQEKVIIYRSVETSQTWVRSYAEFIQEVPVNDRYVPRFKKIKA